MTHVKPTFFGSIIKAIACTPNRALNHADYQPRVTEPTRRLRREAELLGDGRPDPEQARAALATLRSILEAKGVDPAEQDDYFQEICTIHDLDPAALPHLEVVGAGAP